MDVAPDRARNDIDASSTYTISIGTISLPRRALSGLYGSSCRCTHGGADLPWA